MRPPTLTPPIPPAPSPSRPRVIGTRSRATEPGDDIDTGPEVELGPSGPNPWWFFAAGALAALLGQFVLPRNFAWSLAAIPHEMGHATIGCLLGRPSTPAISLAGHAWAGIGERQPLLLVLVTLALLGVAWHQRTHRPRCIALVAAAVLLPIVALTSLAEIAIAAAGHVGELAFAAYCYAIAWSGGRTGSVGERIAGAMAGALLQFGNIRLCAGLMLDAAARAHYATSGSLGLKNDYLVLAEDLCDCRLQAVAGVMLLAAFAALPLGIWLGRLRPPPDGA